IQTFLDIQIERNGSPKRQVDVRVLFGKPLQAGHEFFLYGILDLVQDDADVQAAEAAFDESSRFKIVLADSADYLFNLVAAAGIKLVGYLLTLSLRQFRVLKIALDHAIGDGFQKYECIVKSQ